MTHHLIERAKRSDGSTGRHFLINGLIRLWECHSLASVLIELSKPAGDALPELAELPGLPLEQYAGLVQPGTVNMYTAPDPAHHPPVYVSLEEQLQAVKNSELIYAVSNVDALG